MDDLTHPSARRVAAELRARGVVGPFREFEASTKTTADAAAALECDVGAIASSLVFILDESPVVIIKSGAFRVDLELFTRLVGGLSVRRATAEEVRVATGQSIGGVSPSGWSSTVRVFIDDSLASFDQIWAACGTPNSVFATSYEELLALTSATPLSLALSP